MASTKTIDTPITWSTIFSEWVDQGELRLDGSFYCGESVQSHLQIQNWSGKKTTIGAFAKDIFYPGRFKRVWSSPTVGRPFFTGAQILEAYPQTDKYISPSRIPNINTYEVNRGEMLVTRSGTIGNTVIVHDKLDKQLVTEDAIRIIPSSAAPVGYIYAFLKSKIGKSLIQQSVFGAVIDHVEPNHIADIPLPLLNDQLVEDINKDVAKAYRLRDNASRFIDLAEKELYNTLNLPPVSSLQIKKVGDGDDHHTAWSVDQWSDRMRLDASYYEPEAYAVVEYLKSNFNDVEPLGKRNRIFELPTYKRIYVSPGHGVPFLSGKDLMSSSFTDTKYLARAPIKNLNKYLVSSGTILISMRGTCGNCRLIDSSLDEYGASHNIMRLMPGEDYHAGYLFAFLWSDYGRIQLKSKVLGSVVDVLTPEDCSDVIIPYLAKSKQMSIGKKITEAFEFRALANELESSAIELIESTLTSGS